jgi:MFS family permease
VTADNLEKQAPRGAAGQREEGPGRRTGPPPAGRATQRVARVRRALRSGPLASVPFRLYCAGQLTSTAGDYCYAVALPWLVLANRGSTVLLGSVLACYGLARVLLLPVGGVLADKLGPRPVMLAADVVRCLLVAVLAVLATRHVNALAVLGPLAAVVGAGEGLFLPASLAIVPAIAKRGELEAANGISGGIIQVGSLIGPVLGGLLVVAVGPGPAFVVDAVTFAVSALTLALIRPAAGVAAPLAQAPAAESLAGGAVSAPATLRDLLTSRGFQLFLLVLLVSNAVWGGTQEVALPSLIHQRYGAGGYGAILTAISVGVMAGTFAAAAVKPRRPMFLGLLAYLACGVSCAALPYLGGIGGSAAAAVVLGASSGLGGVLALSVIQRWAPPQLLGQAMSLVVVAAMGVIPLSSALTGILIRHVGSAVFFPLVGLILLCTLAVGLSSRQLRDLGTNPDLGRNPDLGANPG